MSLEHLVVREGKKTLKQNKILQKKNLTKTIDGGVSKEDKNQLKEFPAAKLEQFEHPTRYSSTGL